MPLWAATKALAPDVNAPFLGSYQNTLYFLGLALAAVAASRFSTSRWRGASSPANLARGALGFSAAMSLVLSLTLPGSAYLFVLRVLVALAFRAWGLSGHATGAWHTAAAVALPLAIVLVLMVSVLTLIVLALGARFELASGIPVIGLFVAGATDC